MNSRITAAGAAIGQAQAGVTLPEYPDDCRYKESHAAVTLGAEARVVLMRQRNALDRQNARTERCAAFYDETKTSLAGSAK